MSALSKENVLSLLREHKPLASVNLQPASPLESQCNVALVLVMQGLITHKALCLNVAEQVFLWSCQSLKMQSFDAFKGLELCPNHTVFLSLQASYHTCILGGKGINKPSPLSVFLSPLSFLKVKEFFELLNFIISSFGNDNLKVKGHYMQVRQRSTQRYNHRR